MSGQSLPEPEQPQLKVVDPQAKRLHVAFPEEQRRWRTKPRWVVEHMSRRGAVIAVCGLIEARKSLVLADFAIHVANELESFLGREIKEGGPVLIFAGDDGPEMTVDRLKKVALFRLGRTDYEHIAIVGRGEFNFRSEDARFRLDEAVADCASEFGEAPALIIFDTAASHGAPTQDYGHDYWTTMGWLKEVAEQYECCIILVDHEAQPGPDRPNLSVRMRPWGSMMKAGFFEAAWSLRRLSRERTRLEISDKASIERPDFVLTFGNDHRAYSMDFYEPTPPRSHDDMVLDALTAAESPLTPNQLVDAVTLPRSSVDRALARLVKADRAEKVQEASGSRPALYRAKGA